MPQIGVYIEKDSFDTSIWAFVSSKASLCCFYLSLSLSIF